MLEDARTKDVFREMDGFLVVMNALSTLPAADPAKEAKFSDKMRTEIVEAARLVFMILSEAMFQHQENAEYFKVHGTLSITSGPDVSTVFSWL